MVFSSANLDFKGCTTWGFVMHEDMDVGEYKILFFKSFRARHYVTYHQWDSTIGTFEQKHVYSPYLSTVTNRHFRNILTRFRSGYHWLEICQGRYSNTPRDMRCRPNCTGVIEQERHALLTPTQTHARHARTHERHALLTPTQTEHKQACWSTFVQARKEGKRAQWRAHSLFVEGKLVSPPNKTTT
jgi:hypothetical protein